MPNAPGRRDTHRTHCISRRPAAATPIDLRLPRAKRRIGDLESQARAATTIDGKTTTLRNADSPDLATYRPGHLPAPLAPLATINVFPKWPSAHSDQVSADANDNEIASNVDQCRTSAGGGMEVKLRTKGLSLGAQGVGCQVPTCAADAWNAASACGRRLVHLTVLLGERLVPGGNRVGRGDSSTGNKLRR